MGNSRRQETSKSLIESPTLAVDLLPSLFVDSDADVADAALEVYTKRVYRAHNVISTDIIRVDGLDSMNFKFQFNTYPEESPLRFGVMVVTSTLETAKLQMAAILDRLASHIGDESKDTPIHVLHIALSNQGRRWFTRRSLRCCFGRIPRDEWLNLA